MVQQYGVRIGEDRAVVDTPNWERKDSEELFNAATQSNFPDHAAGMADNWAGHGYRLADAADELARMFAEVQHAWNGSAARSASGGLTSLAQWVSSAGATAAGIGDAVSSASVAADEVRRMPPPRKFDLGSAIGAMVTGGPVALQADLAAQDAEAKKVKQEQVSYLNSYTQAMTAIDGRTPTFAPAPPVVADGADTMRGGSSSGGIAYRPSNVRGSGTSTGRPGAPATGAPAPGAPGASLPAASGSGRTALPGDGTDTSGFTPGGLPGGGGLSPTVSVVVGSPDPAPGTTGGFGPVGGDPRAAGQGGRGVPVAGGGSGEGGRGGPGGRGPASGFGGTGEPVGPAGRGGAAGAGRAGAGLGGMGGGAGVRKEEDVEHERPSYLVEGDPEGTFGTDELTAPPVIGQE